MEKEIRQKAELDRPAIEQEQVPGELVESWTDCAGSMTTAATSERNSEQRPVTTLTGAVDQAALRSLLRRLYSQGLPLLSAICLECR